VMDVVVFFFFQAEDGIRDVAVTGVQTCALPISRRLTRERLGSPRAERHRISKAVSLEPALQAGDRGGDLLDGSARLRRFQPDHRSEERRVGKECRSRWSPYH